MTKQLTTALILCLSIVSPPVLAYATEIWVANTDSSCYGRVDIEAFNSDDTVRMVPNSTLSLENGKKGMLRCQSKKRCYLIWHDAKGKKGDRDTVGKKNNDKDNPYVLKCKHDW